MRRLEPRDTVQSTVYTEMKPICLFAVAVRRAFASERVDAMSLHHATVKGRDWLSPIHSGMNRNNVDQCLFDIVVYHRKSLLQFLFVLSHSTTPRSGRVHHRYEYAPYVCVCVCIQVAQI